MDETRKLEEEASGTMWCTVRDSVYNGKKQTKLDHDVGSHRGDFWRRCWLHGVLSL